jgi:8-oxo-dGTP pyrophosphatase MutT (NUDIX family)
MKLRVRAECFTFKRNKVLADISGSWVVFPGGGVDPGESPKEAAKREAHEEAGRRVMNLTVAHTPTVQLWEKDYAEKQKWSEGFDGGLTYWFTGSTSSDTTDSSHPDFQSGFEWHPIDVVLRRLKQEADGDWKDDVHVRIKILETHVDSNEKVAWFGSVPSLRAL